ncbi:hypothetical protein ACFLUA_01585 [Chloroflexota bacterium]
MDIDFSDLGGIHLQPDEVRIRALEVDPLPSGRLEHVYLEIDPSRSEPTPTWR